MLDQYFGTKELYEVVLRAKTPMDFGVRHIEAEEPVLYFENVKIANLSERTTPIMARGGWGNMPHVIWEDRSEVHFTLSEGVMSSIGMSMLFSAKVTNNKVADPLSVSKREGPADLQVKNDADTDNKECHIMYLEHWPILPPKKKVFIFEYDRDVAQKKVYGKQVKAYDPFDTDQLRPCVAIYEDKELTIPADLDKQYIVDYYYNYTDEALIYTIEKTRFNGLFTLEGKFYSKDENDGMNYTNFIYMPKVRVVSDVNLRLGERADPTTSVFNIIGLPDSKIGHKDGLILEIWRLSEDIDADI